MSEADNEDSQNLSGCQSAWDWYNRPRQNSPPYFLLAVTSFKMTPGILARGVLKNSGNYLSDEH